MSHRQWLQTQAGPRAKGQVRAEGPQRLSLQVSILLAGGAGSRRDEQGTRRAANSVGLNPQSCPEEGQACAGLTGLTLRAGPARAEDVNLFSLDSHELPCEVVGSSSWEVWKQRHPHGGCSFLAGSPSTGNRVLDAGPAHSAEMGTAPWVSWVGAGAGAPLECCRDSVSRRLARGGPHTHCLQAVQWLNADARPAGRGPGSARQFPRLVAICEVAGGAGPCWRGWQGEASQAGPGRHPLEPGSVQHQAPGVKTPLRPKGRWVGGGPLGGPRAWGWVLGLDTCPAGGGGSGFGLPALCGHRRLRGVVSGLPWKHSLAAWPSERGCWEVAAAVDSSH